MNNSIPIFFLFLSSFLLQNWKIASFLPSLYSLCFGFAGFVFHFFFFKFTRLPSHSRLKALAKSLLSAYAMLAWSKVV